MANTDNFTQGILELERRYWNALRDHDLPTALKLTDFPCLLVGSHGVHSVTKEQYEQMFSQDRERIRDFSFDESQAEVRKVGPDTAVIAYKVRTTFGEENSPRTIEAVDTSTWVRRNGEWVCAMHSETELAKSSGTDSVKPT